MSDRPRLSNTDRLRLFRLHGETCHICSQPIDGVHERWEIEHVISRGMIGVAADTDENMRPAHAACHKPKTAADADALGRAKRREGKHFGAHRPRQVMPGSRASGFKRCMSGRSARSAGRLALARVPTPRFTWPLPSGKIQP